MPEGEGKLTKAQEIAQRAKTRQAEKINTGKIILPDPVVEIVQLPLLWGEEERAAPNSILRSPLFGVVKRGPRAYIKDELIASWKGTEIRYKGERLDQSDLDIWLTCLQFSKDVGGLGSRVSTSLHSFLAACGRDDGTESRKWLDRATKRMIANALTVKLANGDNYSGNLIHEFAISHETGQIAFFLNPRLISLFSELTRMNWETRRKLKKDMALWMYGYVLSQEATTVKPHRIGVERLKELCGSEVSDIREFRRSLKAAMTELQKWGVVYEWGYTKNKALEFSRGLASIKSLG